MNSFLLSEGGFHGHMAHLYENPDLTFKKIKEVFQKAAAGELEGTEKTDGQNLYVSYSIKDGKAKAVRNKTQIRAGGLDAEQLANQYKDHPNPAVRDAFVDTFKTFEEVIRKIPDEQKEVFFGQDADIFYNAEVMDPRSANVIYYDIPTLLLHRAGHVKIDKESGKISPLESSEFEEFAESFSGEMAKAQEKMSNRKFDVQINALRKLEAITDGEISQTFINRLENEINQYGISDDQTIGEYIAAKLLAGRLSDLEIPEQNMLLLVKRLIGELQKDESGKYKKIHSNLIKRGLSKEDAKRVANLVSNQGRIFMDEVSPIEEIVHDFAVEALRGLKSAFIIDNTKEAERLRKEVQKAIDIIQASEDEDRDTRISVLERQLEKLKGVDKIYTPAEGFVFDLDGHTYKFTGTFAPINQILGLFKYGRGKVGALPDLTIGPDVSKGEAEFFYKKPEPEQPYIREVKGGGLNLTTQKPESVINMLPEQDTQSEVANYVFIPGGFKPPHKGHLDLIKRAHEFGGPDAITYVFSGKDPRKAGDVVITADKSEKVFYKLLTHMGIPMGNEEAGKVTLKYFDEMDTGVEYGDTEKNRKLDRVGKPIMSKSPMVAIGKKAAKDLPDGAVLNVVSSTADKNHGSVLQNVIEKIAANTGKKFTTNLVSLETVDAEEGKKISATDMRNALADKDYELFKVFLPEDLDEQEAKEIYNILINNKIQESILYSIIKEMVAQKKVKGKKKFCLMSKKKNPKTGKRKNLGCYSTRAGAEKREKQVNMFKHMKKKKLEEYEIIEEFSSVSGQSGGFGSAGPGLPGNFKPHVDPNPYKYVEEDIYKNIVKIYKNANIALGVGTR
tara:strand:+ start:392 stop:2923 length:2532 start_codon:yes stop_codon:yes gene_type:complete